MSRRDVSVGGVAPVPAPDGALALLNPGGAAWRPVWRVLVSTNHKDVGSLYSLIAFIGGCVGGVLSMLVGQQISGVSHGLIAEGNIWNGVIAAHGLVMVFWFLIPALIGGIGNWIVPLMIGAPDTAFPRLNLLSVWLLALGFVAVLFGLLLRSPLAPDFSFAALCLAGASSLLLACNFIATILNMRAHGLGLHKMPLFCWSILVTSLLLVLVLPVLAGVVTILLAGQPSLVTQGPIGAALFARLFWFFGHPEAYIVVLPAFGIISQILSTFTNRPIRAYLVVAYAMVAIGLVGFVVWAHRLFFPAWMGHYVNAASLVLVVPGAILFIAWGMTLYRARIAYKTPMLWALGFVFLFVIGGLMGLAMALTGARNSFNLVAHSHYVLSMGAVFAIFGGFYYWIGKISGRPYPEIWGKIHFWTFFLGVNLTFFPMQFSFYQNWILLSSCGAVLSGVSALVFFYVIFRVLCSRKSAVGNDWGLGATTLEWHVPSPVPLHSFEDLPSVR